MESTFIGKTCKILFYYYNWGMAQGKRTSIETKANIVIDKIKNPDLSVRDLAEKYDVGKSTAWDIIEEVIDELRTSSDITIEIIENDMQSVKNMSEITRRFTEELKAKEELERADIDTANRTTESAFKRSQLLQGKATEKFDFTSLDDSQARLIASRYGS